MTFYVAMNRRWRGQIQDAFMHIGPWFSLQAMFCSFGNTNFLYKFFRLLYKSNLVCGISNREGFILFYILVDPSMTRSKSTIVRNLSLYSLSLVNELTAADKPPTQSRHFYLDFANDVAG